MHEALLILIYIYGLTDFQVAVLHNDLATALEVAGEYGEAERHITKSLEIAGSVSDKDIAEFMAMFYYNLGMILSRQGILIGALSSNHSLRNIVPNVSFIRRFYYTSILQVLVIIEVGIVIAWGIHWF